MRFGKEFTRPPKAAIMKITVMQVGIEYYYECSENCHYCPIRFICYTTPHYQYKGETIYHMTLAGNPELDLRVGQSMIDGTLKRTGSCSDTWSGLSG